jgi:hypothetical protein
VRNERFPPAARHPALSVGLVAGGLLLLVVGVPALWVDRVVLDTDRYTAAVGPLVEDPAFQARLAERIVAVVDTAVDLPALVSDVLDRQVRRVVGTGQFQEVWTRAVRESHERLAAALTGTGEGIEVTGSALTVEVAPLVAAARERLVATGVPWADRIPDVDATLTLAESPRIGQARGVARFADAWAVPLTLAALAMMTAGVLLAPSRTRALVTVGLGTAAGMAVILLVLLVARSQAGDLPARVVSAESGHAVFDALTAPLRGWALGIGAFGLLLAGGAVAAARTALTSVPAAGRPD